MRAFATACFLLLACVCVPTRADALTLGSPCPTITLDRLRAEGVSFTGIYDVGFFSLQTHPRDGRRGMSICVSHHGNTNDCTISGPGFLHAKLAGTDTYYALPVTTVVSLIVKDGRLSCTVK
jgi:hypothetical protein